MCNKTANHHSTSLLFRVVHMKQFACSQWTAAGSSGCYCLPNSAKRLGTVDLVWVICREAVPCRHFSLTPNCYSFNGPQLENGFATACFTGETLTSHAPSALRVCSALIQLICGPALLPKFDVNFSPATSAKCPNNYTSWALLETWENRVLNDGMGFMECTQLSRISYATDQCQSMCLYSPISALQLQWVLVKCMNATWHRAFTYIRSALFVAIHLLGIDSFTASPILDLSIQYLPNFSCLT